MNILKYPNKILRTKSNKITDFKNPSKQSFFNDLKKTMQTADGLGLAANQVGETIRVMAVNCQNGPLIICNPFIYWKSWKKNLAEEGCLSFPGIFGSVNRNNQLYLFYRDELGKLKHLRASGLLARVILHENDHLNGRLFIDKITKYSSGEKQLIELRNQAQNDEI